MNSHIKPGLMVNEREVAAQLREAQASALFDQYADALRAGREKEFLQGLTSYQFDALAASLKKEKVS